MGGGEEDGGVEAMERCLIPGANGATGQEQAGGGEKDHQPAQGGVD